MKIIEILTSTNGVTRNVVIECDRRKRSLTLILEDGSKKSYVSYDIYACLGLIRAEFPDTKFLCKGAKLNVHPSSMSSQMSAGVVAYELHSGKPSEAEDIVNIFDFDEDNITNDIQQQRDFYRCWIDSLNK